MWQHSTGFAAVLSVPISEVPQLRNFVRWFGPLVLPLRGSIGWREHSEPLEQNTPSSTKGCNRNSVSGSAHGCMLRDLVARRVFGSKRFGDASDKVTADSISSQWVSLNKSESAKVPPPDRAGGVSIGCPPGTGT